LTIEGLKPPVMAAVTEGLMAVKRPKEEKLKD
jgi:hypothetical protein